MCGMRLRSGPLSARYQSLISALLEDSVCVRVQVQPAAGSVKSQGTGLVKIIRLRYSMGMVKGRDGFQYGRMFA